MAETVDLAVQATCLAQQLLRQCARTKSSVRADSVITAAAAPSGAGDSRRTMPGSFGWIRASLSSMNCRHLRIPGGVSG